MQRQLFILLSLLMLSVVGSGQAVHYFTCVEVQENGDVQLSWEPAGNQGDFISYDIYQTTIANPGNFQLIDQVLDYNTNTYLHSPTTANQQTNLYFIKTIQNGLSDIPSDTLKSIHLTVDNSDPNLAILDWNAMHNPLLAASDNFYTVYMHDHQSAFSVVGTTLDTHFEIPLEVCRDTFYFRVDIADNNACVSTSNIYSAVFEDITPPPMPVLDSVSIDPFSGEVILGWSQSTAGDAGGYVVYHVLPSINDTLAFVFGALNTTYADQSFDPCSVNRAYALASFDTCGNISPGSYDIPQRTILLSEIIFDPCLMTNTFTWTEYINMNPSLEGYRILLSTDGGPFSLLASMPSGITAYEHSGLLPGHEYRYFIRAFSLNDAVTSSSCIREQTTWQYLQPLDNSIENVSVQDNEFIAIDMLPDTIAFISSIKLFRGDQSSGPFELLADLDPQGSDIVVYDDETAEVQSQSYYYRTELLDSCGNQVLPTTLMRSILLQGEKAVSPQNMLEWNAFEGWVAGVEKYEVYRSINDGGSELIAETNNATLQYADDLSTLSSSYSSLRYIVRALKSGNSGLFSWSNEILFEYSPSLYLPNAFTPGGQNPVFKPEGAFAEFSEYRLDVYDRWGALIFSSRDFGTGWDGVYKGKAAPVGVYVCVLNYISTTGDSQSLKSTFVLLR